MDQELDQDGYGVVLQDDHKMIIWILEDINVIME